MGAGVIMPDRDTRQGAVQGIADIYARETQYNQLSFLIRSLINKEINTPFDKKNFRHFRKRKTC